MGNNSFGVNHRKLNEMILKNKYVLLRMDNYLASLGQASSFFTLYVYPNY